MKHGRERHPPRPPYGRDPYERQAERKSGELRSRVPGGELSIIIKCNQSTLEQGTENKNKDSKKKKIVDDNRLCDVSE